MAALPFLDTNILLRHLRHDIPHQSQRATAFIERIERGELKVRTAETVIFEAVYTLQRTYKVPKADIRANLLPIIELPGLVLPGKRRFRRVFDLYVDLNLPFADAYHVGLMQQWKLTEIISFDQELDRVPGISRREPQ
jgi:predicted nucleic acid-binding protein